MTETFEEQKVYYIPENYADETRILQGQIRLRFFLEAAVLALTGAALQFLIPVSDFKARITLMILAGAPGLLLGLTGYNGDTIFTALRLFLCWKRQKEIVIYNPNGRLLSKTPIEAATEEVTSLDRIVDFVDAAKAKIISRRKDMEYIEGETFDFIEDPDIAMYISEEDEEKRQALIAKNAELLIQTDSDTEEREAGQNEI